MNIALMASGQGTNALKLIEHARSLKNITMVGIIVDQASSQLLNEKLLVPVILIEKKAGQKKADHEKQILQQLQEWKTDWILLAGYMRILGKNFLNHYKNKVINIHPSLLPLYPGAHAYERAFDAKDSESGVTVHFVDEGMDTGAIWRQQTFRRFPDDSLDDFIARGKLIEWSLYPSFLDWLSQNSLESK